MEVSSEQELSGRARKEIGAFGGGGVGGRGVTRKGNVCCSAGVAKCSKVNEIYLSLQGDLRKSCASLVQFVVYNANTHKEKGGAR